MLIPPAPTPPCPYWYSDQAEFERVQSLYLIERGRWEREAIRVRVAGAIIVMCAAAVGMAAALFLPGMLVDMIQIAVGR